MAMLDLVALLCKAAENMKEKGRIIEVLYNGWFLGELTDLSKKRLLSHKSYDDDEHEMLINCS
jgi:hypothetical protein